jgi:uncharacterized OB-fold protein
MAQGDTKKKVAVKEGLYKLPDDRDPGSLIGSKCKACGEIFHPPRVTCANCFSEDLQEIALSRRGRIYTYTIGHVAYPGTPVTAPFITAQVELPEKVHVLSLITGMSIDQVKIGTEVELYFWKAAENKEGNELIAYGFRPVST